MTDTPTPEKRFIDATAAFAEQAASYAATHTQHTVFFVAMIPDPAKALGSTIYYLYEDARAQADFWQRLAPYRVFSATMTVDADQPATTEGYSHDD